MQAKPDIHNHQNVPKFNNVSFIGALDTDQYQHYSSQRDNIWSDIEIIPEQDEFCETCKITTAQKANRGKQPLEGLEPVVPGTFVMMDIINNPSSRSKFSL
jgi:hypothetical protein